MYWYHEIVNAPLDATSATNPTELDLVTHYTDLDTAHEENNWHYLEVPTNVLLPLKSLPWPSGTPRVRLGPTGGDPGATSTDLFGCHGTSGSGVLQRNSSGYLELLGPVHTGGAWASTRLCNNPTFQSGEMSLTYANNADVNWLFVAYYTEIVDDRVLPPGPCPVEGC
jgi:hypothetical protein